MYKKIKLPNILLFIGLCIGLCACHAADPDRASDLDQPDFSQEITQQPEDFAEPFYRDFRERANAERMALIRLDGDDIPELLIQKDGEYELYRLDGSAVCPISMPDAPRNDDLAASQPMRIHADTSGPKYSMEGGGRTLYWFEYVPGEGLIRVHEGDEEGRRDYYLRYEEGRLSPELEMEDGVDGRKTYEADREIEGEEFRGRLTELGYDGLVPCAYLYDDVETAFENMDAPTDSRKRLEDFVNGRTYALCYEEGHSKAGIPTEEGLFLRNYEEIYEDITCGETWWGSLCYVDFDNDGQEELVMGGYVNSKMFFDVIGDTVYEVLHTSSTTDMGHVAERNGRRVIERTDLLHSNRQYYWITEYDACCNVVDQFSLHTNFAGERYAEGDEFAYRGRKITMGEFEEIRDGFHSIGMEDRVLDYWVGEYEFSESVSDPVPMVMNYRMKIFCEDGEYYADIEIDGQLTLARMRAEPGLESGGDRIELQLKEYLPDHVSGGTNAKEGEILLTLERKNNRILTVWGAITPMLYENEKSGKVYFVKKSGED